MRSRFSTLLVFSLLGLGFVLAGCGGGGGTGPRTPTADCGGGTFCLVSCNLGCSTSGDCAINSIAQNQAVTLEFSDFIDPASVNGSSISIATATGERPIGSFIVDGKSIAFVPEVGLVGGLTTFGFRAQEEYLLSLPGGPTEQLSLRSASGDPLVRTVSCSLFVDQGLVDANNRAPTATLVTPGIDERDVPPNPLIVLEFDELIDTAAFQGGSTESSPIGYFFRRIDPNTGGPDEAFQRILIPGVPQAETVLGANPLTRILLQPLTPLPPAVCVEVVVNDQVRDISGTPAIPVTFRFYTEVGMPVIVRKSEEFTQTGRFDRSVSSAKWGGGSLQPGSVGSDGLAGSFDIGMLPMIPSTNIFVWDTDTVITVPAENSLLGDQETDLVGGRAEFSSFRVPENVVLRFVGSAAPLIRVSGQIVVDGTIELDGDDAILPPGFAGFTSPSPAGLPAIGGPGGGSGGMGAMGLQPLVLVGPPGPEFSGADGDPAQPLAISGYAGMVDGTEGRGSLLHPPSGLIADVVYDIVPQVGVVISAMQISGGGGGGFFAPGDPGSIDVLLGDPANNQPPALGGSGIAFMLPPSGIDSIDQFLIGGSGGGGGGSAPTLSRGTPPVGGFTLFTNGCGGGGGGGAIGLRAGGSITIGSTGRITARGGDTPSHMGHSTFASNGAPRGIMPGGGGSGGAIVLQSESGLIQSGTIDLRGGVAGTLTSQPDQTANPPTLIGESSGGDGAPGFVRFESPGATINELGTVTGPTLGPDNVGPLTESDPKSVARSTFYSLNSLLPPRLIGYEIVATINGMQQTFSDDPNSPDSPINFPGSPIRLLMQGATVDPLNLTPIGEPGAWVETTVEMAISSPTGFRFIMFFDTTLDPTVSVDSFDLVYEI